MQAALRQRLIAFFLEGLPIARYDRLNTPGLFPCQPSETFLHEFDLNEVTLQAVIAADLPRRGTKAARGKLLSPLRAA